MTSKVVNVPELTGSNYTIWKCKMIDVLKGKNLWWIVNGDIKKPTDMQRMWLYGKKL
jgi:hypothetical protein